MRAIAPFVLQVIALQLTGCRGDGVSGGPSTFGYDASSACSKSHSRRGRAYYENLPCDFRRQNWCMSPGSSYPWRAVRRFVQENQGLMRRMYGDENYINVLQTEFEKNDIELKYDYRHHFVDDSRQFQYDEYEFIDDDRSTININGFAGREFTSRSFNDPVAKRMNKFSKLSEYTRPHFRPTERTTSSTVSSATTSSSTSPSTLASSTIFGMRTTSSSTTPATTITTMTSTEEIKTLTSQKFSNTTTEITDGDPIMNNVTTTTTSSPSVTVAQIVKEQNFSINEIPGQNDRIDVNPVEFIEISNLRETTVKEDATLKPAGTATTTGSPIKLLVSQDEEEMLSAETGTKTIVLEETIATTSHEQQQEFRPRPEYRPSDVTEASTSTSGQLYQDATKDSEGIHACPVKIEVVAPFWANNTRGEVLALLNLYPFEQYVHWEKCVHENKQMLCRDGCKCIQQYRLHRLLAYDPNNECRGIFSDWFRFPSCCICYCFDLPLQFRVASRSPRISHKRRIKVRPPTRERYP